jgi:hypothetical protein
MDKLYEKREEVDMYGEVVDKTITRATIESWRSRFENAYSKRPKVEEEEEEEEEEVEEEVFPKPAHAKEKSTVLKKNLKFKFGHSKKQMQQLGRPTASAMGYGQGQTSGVSSFKSARGGGLDTNTGCGFIGRKQWHYDPHSLSLPKISSAPVLTKQAPNPEITTHTQRESQKKLLGQTKSSSVHAGMDIAATAKELQCDHYDLEQWTLQHPQETLPDWWFTRAHKARESNKRAKLHWKDMQSSVTGEKLSRLTIKTTNNHKKRMGLLKQRKEKRALAAKRGGVDQAQRVHRGLIPDGQGCAREWGDPVDSSLVGENYGKRERLIIQAESLSERLESTEARLERYMLEMPKEAAAHKGAVVAVKLAEEEIDHAKTDHGLHTEAELDAIDTRDSYLTYSLKGVAQPEVLMISLKKSKKFLAMEGAREWAKTMKEAAVRKIEKKEAHMRRAQVHVVECVKSASVCKKRIEGLELSRQQLLMQMHAFREEAYAIMPHGMRIRQPDQMRVNQQSNKSYIGQLFQAFGSDEGGSNAAIIAAMTIGNGGGGGGGDEGGGNGAGGGIKGGKLHLNSERTDIVQKRWLCRKIFKAWAETTYKANLSALSDSKATRVQVICSLGATSIGYALPRSIGLSLSPQATGMELKRALCKKRGVDWVPGDTEHKILLMYEEMDFPDCVTLEDLDFISNSVVTVQLMVKRLGVPVE